MDVQETKMLVARLDESLDELDMQARKEPLRGLDVSVTLRGERPSELLEGPEEESRDLLLPHIFQRGLGHRLERTLDTQDDH